jgi:hypothetical protein
MEKLLVEHITEFLEYCELERQLSPLTVIWSGLMALSVLASQPAKLSM